MTALTVEQKRVKIAEARGIKVETRWWADDAGGVMFTPDAAKERLRAWPLCFNTKIIPDYFGDLNACHEMKASLSDAELESYREELIDFVEKETGLQGYAAQLAAIDATPAQRAEAFGLALGLWEEGQ